MRSHEVLFLSLGVISGRITPCKLSIAQQGDLMDAWMVSDPFNLESVEKMKRCAEEYVTNRILDIESKLDQANDIAPTSNDLC